ncbi:hypothetical protein TRAPUB_13296 [Trametes pubescens]|uniref:Uncharacterized protein n=1 Tax=Trametes pubescens TaxID=154538 RepID=A0A1M2VRG2_TRAPU|nr:hypothetical protein TRAPUB_13296 [Trametes pubescens]
MPEHDKLRHACWRARFAEGGAYKERRGHPAVGAEPRGEGAEGLTRRDNREASFVHVELISAGDGCPDGGEAEAA